MFRRGLSGKLAAICWTLVVVLGAAPLLAQSITTGTIFGVVTDQSNHPVENVEIKLTTTSSIKSVTTHTDQRGRYSLPNVRPDRYTLTASLQGLSAEPLHVVVRVGSTNKIDIQMTPSTHVSEKTTVTGRAPVLESTTSQVNKYVSFKEIQNLPLENRQFLDVLKILPGVTTGIPTGTYNDRGPRNSFTIHGARSNQNDFLLDGAANNDKSDLNYEDIASVQVLGGPRSGPAGRAGQTFQVGTALQTYNLDAIQEVQVSTSMFSAEFGSGGSGGVINVITRNGTDTMQGSATLQEQRDAWIKDAQKQAINRKFGALALGGPIVKGKAHYFMSYERDDEKLGFDFSQPSYYVPDYLKGLGLTANQTKRDHLTLKLDDAVNDHNEFTLTGNYQDEWANDLNTIFRSRALSDAVPEFFENRSTGLILRDVAMLSANRNLESVVNGTHVTRLFNSSNDNPRKSYNFYVPSYHSYTTGGNSPDNNNSIDTLGWSEKLSWTTDTLNSKVGLEFSRFKQHSQQVRYLSYYLFPDSGNPEEYLLIPPTNFSVSVNDIALFGQTDWYLTPKTTLNLGLRTQHDDLVGETTIEPRLGVAYDPSGKGREVLRAGVGLYHDRTNLIGETGALRPPVTLGTVVNGQLVPDGLPTTTVVDPNLKLPTIYKAVLGYERQIGQSTSAGVTLFANFSRDLFYQETLNRPDINGNSPDPTRGPYVLYSNFGKSDVYDLEFDFRHQFGNGSEVSANYTYEHATGNSAFDFISGNDPINRDSQYAEQPHAYQVSGPLPSQIKHNLKLSGVFNLPWGLQFSTFINFHTGEPYYWYTTWYELPQYFPHFDFYGGGYNSQTLDNYFSADVRLAKSFNFATHSLEVFFDVFNVTDRKNVLARNQLYAYNYGAPIGAPGTTYYSRWDQPIFYGPRRTAQLGVKFTL